MPEEPDARDYSAEVEAAFARWLERLANAPRIKVPLPPADLKADLQRRLREAEPTREAA